MSIHKSVIIEEGAIIGSDVVIEPFSIIRKNVEIGEKTFIGSNCDIGVGNSKKLIIGKNSLIRSHSVIYGGSIFSENLETGHKVTIREGVKAGINLRIGTFGDLQGDMKIGNYVRMHSNVFLSKNILVGNFVWLMPFVNTATDPHPPSKTCNNIIINDYACIATKSLLLPGIEIGSKSLVGAFSKVTQSTEKDYLYAGNPAKKICHLSKIRLKDGSNKSAYPWMNHYHIGYPNEVVQKWLQSNYDIR